MGGCETGLTAHLLRIPRHTRTLKESAQRVSLLPRQHHPRPLFRLIYAKHEVLSDMSFAFISIAWKLMLHAKNYLFCVRFARALAFCEEAARWEGKPNGRLLKWVDVFITFIFSLLGCRLRLGLARLFSPAALLHFFRFLRLRSKASDFLWLFRIKIFLCDGMERVREDRGHGRGWEEDVEALWSGNVLLRILYHRKSFYLNNIFLWHLLHQ